MGLEDIWKAIGEMLVPIKNLNANELIRAIKNPIIYRKLVLDEKQAILIYIGDTNEIKVVGGIEYSNVVFNPEIGKGWVTSKKSTYTLDKKKAFIVSPMIPFTLELKEDDFHKQYSISGKVRQMLGLPLNWIQLQCDMLAMMAMNKWNAGFDESKGSVMIALFGGAIGMVCGVITTLFFVIILGALT